MAIRVEDAAQPGPADFEAFYAAYVARVRALVRRRVRAAHRVDDIVQETFIRAHRNADSFDATKAVWPWLATIANNLVIDSSRRRSHTHEQPVELRVLDRDGGGPDPALQFQRTEQRAAIAEALNALPSRQRRVLIRREIDALRYDAVAAEEGLTVDAVKGLLKRARGGFREAYATLADERGLWAIGLLPLRYLRSAATRVSAYAGSISDLLNLAAAPLAAVAASAALTSSVVGANAVTSRPPHPLAAAVATAAPGRLGANPATAVTSRARVPASAPTNAVRVGKSLTPGDTGLSNRLDAGGPNLEYSNALKFYFLGKPHTLWVQLATQCHTNPVHDVLCALANTLPHEITVGDPQQTPIPVPPPAASELLAPR